VVVVGDLCPPLFHIPIPSPSGSFFSLFSPSVVVLVVVVVVLVVVLVVVVVVLVVVCFGGG
jgi:hypothetical protein